MNSLFRKFQVPLIRQVFALNQALTPCRATPSIQNPVWATASVNERQHRDMPTHKIGSWRFLFRKRVHRKKKDRYKMRPLCPVSDTAYGTLNVMVSGHDMTVVEHYTEYIHNLCNRLSIRVSLCYALPTKTTEVMLMQEQGTKMYVDAILKTHERVVQLRKLDTTLCPVFMEVILKNQPEGVQLSVKEHTEAHYKARFKARPELEELMVKINQ
ncbi:39S ribosomal protein L48, mitochondrial-like [Lates japonicus]